MPPTEVDRALTEEARTCNRCGRRWTYVVGATAGRDQCGYCGADKGPDCDVGGKPSSDDTAEARA